MWKHFHHGYRCHNWTPPLVTGALLWGVFIALQLDASPRGSSSSLVWPLSAAIKYLKYWHNTADISILPTRITKHSLSECGFEILKTYPAPAHIWDLPRWWKSLLLMYKIFDRRTFGLSHQITGPTTVKLAIFGYFTIGASFSHFYSCWSFNLMW